MKKIFVITCLLATLAMCIGCASPKENRDERKNAIVDEAVAFLKENHPDIYRNVSEKEFLKEEERLKRTTGSMDDFTFNLALSGLVASIGDSHTKCGISMKPLATSVTGVLYPFAVTQFAGEYRLTSIDEGGKAYLGWVVEKIGGKSVDQIIQKLSPVISHDNKVKLRRNALQLIPLKPVLSSIGIDEGDHLTLHLSNGKEKVDYWISAQTYEETKASTLSTIENTPSKSLQGKGIYWYERLDDGTLYLQYNSCREDKDYPMGQMTKEIAGERFDAIIIDLRNNGGGSDGVLNPILKLLDERKGTKIRVLIGEDTFSSAIINAVELKDLGGVLVGEATSGSVDHFGATTGKRLSNGLSISCSTKEIRLEDYFPWCSYGYDSLVPDIEATETFDDYMAGHDNALERARNLD
jgi:C-terminal processing protease CtpA/Prc